MSYENKFLFHPTGDPKQDIERLRYELMKEFTAIQKTQAPINSTVTIIAGAGGGGGSAGSTINIRIINMPVSVGMNTVSLSPPMPTINYIPAAGIFASDNSYTLAKFQVSSNSPAGDTRTVTSVLVDCDTAGMLVGMAIG